MTIGSINEGCLLPQADRTADVDLGVGSLFELVTPFYIGAGAVELSIGGGGSDGDSGKNRPYDPAGESPTRYPNPGAGPKDAPPRDTPPTGK